jgi:transposase
MKDFKVNESKSRLKYLRKSISNHRLKTRILFLIEHDNPKYKTRKDLATFLDVSVWSLQRWIDIYMNKGIDELLNISSGGKRRVVVTNEVHLLLEEKLKDYSDPLLSYKEAVTWVSEQVGVLINYTTLRAYMIKNFKTKLKVPRKSHYKNDKQAVEVFKKLTN